MRNIICFHKPKEENGYLSNWYPSDFVVGDTPYSSGEQYMMHQKAQLFHDGSASDMIMRTDDVALIKEMGRLVRNYDDEVWAGSRKNIIVMGLLEKFSQNETLKEKLLSTGDTLLAECSVSDKVWGIGLSMTNPNRFNPSAWKGQNNLGNALMEVRDCLRLNLDNFYDPCPASFTDEGKEVLYKVLHECCTLLGSRGYVAVMGPALHYDLEPCKGLWPYSVSVPIFKYFSSFSLFKANLEELVKEGRVAVSSRGMQFIITMPK